MLRIKKQLKLGLKKSQRALSVLEKIQTRLDYIWKKSNDMQKQKADRHSLYEDRMQQKHLQKSRYVILGGL